jgi:hypothetical protein
VHLLRVTAQHLTTKRNIRIAMSAGNGDGEPDERRCNPEMLFNFAVQKTNRSKEALVLNERIFSFRRSGQHAKGPEINIYDKDNVDRQITKENFKRVGFLDAELLIQVSTTGCKDYPFVASSVEEFNTIKFLLNLVRGDVEPGDLLETYPSQMLYYGAVEKLVNGRWSTRFIMIIPHRVFSFACETGEDHPRNVIPLRNARISTEIHQEEAKAFIKIDHSSLNSPFIFRNQDARQEEEVKLALQRAFSHTKSSPLFSSAAVLGSSAPTSKMKNLPLDRFLSLFLTFSVKVRVSGQPPQSPPYKYPQSVFSCTHAEIQHRCP